MHFNYATDPYSLTFTVNGDKMTTRVVGEGNFDYNKMTYVDPGTVPGGGGNNNPNPDAPETIGNIKYKVENGNYGYADYLLVSVFFGRGHTSGSAYVGNATVHHQHYADGNTQMDSYVGGHSYDKTTGNGTINLKDVETSETVGTATFRISGTTLTLDMLGENYTLAKQ